MRCTQWRQWRRWTVLSVLGATSACAGPDGPAGPVGETAEAGAQGIAGPSGPAGPAGAGATTLGDAGIGSLADIPVGCLSPCHGFNGVVAQFQTSAHYIAYVQNLGTAQATEWLAPGSACGNCHAIDALGQRVAGAVGTTNDAGIVNLASGELQYRDPVTSVLSSATYVGSAATAEVYCTTCHAVTNANDPHKTGLPWTPGSFPLTVSESGVAINIERSPTTSAVTGTQASGPKGGDYGPGSTCMWCHRSRVDVTNYLTASNVITSTHWGPHEGPQADLFTGTGGYQYAGQTYGQSTHEQKLSCVDCHMVNMADNGGIPDHSFNPSLSACLNCHAGATSFDVSGFEGQIQGSLTVIETYLNSQGLLTRAATAPYAPLGALVGDGNWALDQPVPAGGIDGGVQSLTKDQAGALYNYILVARGGAYGAHNPKYIAEILYDSYKSLTGLTLPAFPVDRP